MRIKELRQKKELTQEELGNIVNQSKSTISKYENGGLEPSVNTLNTLASIFDVSIDYLVGRSEEKGSYKLLTEEMAIFLDKFCSLSEGGRVEALKYLEILEIRDRFSSRKDL